MAEKVHVFGSRCSTRQFQEMLLALGTYIKLAVDIRRGVVAGGGGLHFDCEEALLDDGSLQEDIWGADWVPEIQDLKFQAMINIRPSQSNPSMEVLDPTIRSKIAEIVKPLMEGL